MNSIRIKNLRSLRDTEEISIKKINILVGNNSSGKSTFLRVFPLLKQSFNKKINGPILWCGDDDDYVDFGSFKEALNYSSESKSITLAFEIQINYMGDDVYHYRHFRQNEDLRKVKIEFSIKNSRETGNDFISDMRYIIKDQTVLISFSDKDNIEEVLLNGEKVKIETTRDSFYPPFYDQPIFDISLYPIREVALQKLMHIFSMNEDEEKNSRFIEGIVQYIFNTKILHEKTNRKYNDKIVEMVNKVYNDNNKKELEQWSFLYNLVNHFSIISNYLKTYFRNVYYIAPVRATAERYYRLRNAAVNEVDCRGKNLPVFLNSLSSTLFSQFQAWTKEHLGFEVVKSTSEGHVSLKVRKNGQDKAVNLSDTGFGYSQILPIVTQIWYIAKKSEEEKNLPFYVQDVVVPTTIVIEQPELHLHPALQAKLIDIIVKVANQGNINFIIETHSETMVNRVGNSISKKQMSNNEVGVIIFEKDFGADNTNIKKGGFDEEGYLENWPVGFFEPGME